LRAYEKIKLVIEIERKKINIALVCILWSFIFTAYDVAIVISTSHAIFRRFTWCTDPISRDEIYGWCIFVNLNMS